MEEVYLAVRCTEGREWFDLDTITCLSRREAERKAKKVDMRCGPYWHKSNPVVRIACCRITEFTPYYDAILSKGTGQ